MAIRVLLADDHALFRESVKLFLESQPDLTVVAEASAGWEAVWLSRLHQPDVAVVDVRMSDLTGIQAIPHILRHSPRTAILMLSIHRDMRYISLSEKAGARGYVLKEAAEEMLIPAIRELSAGHCYFTAELAAST